MKLLLFLLPALLLSASTSAETLVVDYASFYSHVKKLDDPQTNALRFAFGFWHIAEKRMCEITSAQIVTQKQQMPLIVELTNRFTVPVDKILKMAKAKVKIELADQANQCDMSVQLETLPNFLKHHYSGQELLMLFNQYQAFFSDMGGFLSFMMPSVQGLLVKVENGQNLSTELTAMLNTQGDIQLTKNWIEQGNMLTLPHKPLRITAFIEK